MAFSNFGATAGNYSNTNNYKPEYTYNNLLIRNLCLSDIDFTASKLSELNTRAGQLNSLLVNVTFPTAGRIFGITAYPHSKDAMEIYVMEKMKEDEKDFEAKQVARFSYTPSKENEEVSRIYDMDIIVFI